LVRRERQLELSLAAEGLDDRRARVGLRARLS